MPISVQSIIDRCRPALDDETPVTPGNPRRRYEDTEDLIPAINYGIDWIIGLLNSIMSKNKLSEESVSEILKVRVFYTNEFSRFRFDEVAVGNKIWSIIAVYPKPTIKTNPVVHWIPPTDTTQSSATPHSFVKSYYSCARATLEEVSKAHQNPFAAGNEIVMCPDLMEFTYTTFADYGVGYSYPAGSSQLEIEINRAIPREFVALAYIQYPEPVSLVTDSVMFPQSLTDLMVERTLSYISKKMNDGTNLYGTTAQATATLTKMFS